MGEGLVKLSVFISPSTTLINQFSPLHFVNQKQRSNQNSFINYFHLTVQLTLNTPVVISLLKRQGQVVNNLSNNEYGNAKLPKELPTTCHLLASTKSKWDENLLCIIRIESLVLSYFASVS